MRCSTCQIENPDGAPFCAECGSRLTAPPSPPPTNLTGALPQQTVLQDRYVITQKLGQGGMGAVYRATDRRLGSVLWAVKEMSEAAITGPLERQQARDSFLREAEMLAALSHPNLPRVTDHFEQSGKAYLVMEFVPGETLLSFLQREGLPQSIGRVIEWARQICDVLEYLHNQNPPIIFRDLKPANIMLTPQGQVKLIDFGIARLFKPGQARDTQAFGTVGYSAPEQYGRGQTDARSDVYSLAALLHQLLTGYDPTSTPFHLPPASQVNPNIPSAMSAALSTATDSAPERRFPDIRTFRDALFGAAGAVIVQPGSQPYGQASAGGAVYQRPASQPYGQAPAGAQPYGQLPASDQAYGQPGSQPYGQPAVETTGLANGSRWVGFVSAAMMALAVLMVVIGAAGGDSSSPIAGFGILMAIPAIGMCPVALVMGVIALMRPQTNQTLSGRRHAIMGVAGGVASLLLCCVIGLIAGVAGGAAR